MSRLSRKNSNSKAVDILNDSSEDFAPSVVSVARTLSTTSNECKKAKAVKKKPEQKQQVKNGSLDPNLELAVALSASLNPKDNIVLPGASSWNAPKKKVPSQTPLELRSMEERNRLIADKVSSILLDEGNRQPTYLASSIYPPLPKAKLKSTKLLKALNAKNHSLWGLSSQKLRASSRFYVPSLLPSCKKLETQIDDEKKPSALSPMSLLSNNLLSLVNESRGSDICVYVKGDKKILAHSIIFYCRFPCLLKDVILEGEAQLIMWPEVYFDSAISFLRFVYGAIFPESISTKSELYGLCFLSQKYKMSDLSSFLKNIDERDLIDDSDEVVEGKDEEIEGHTTATQNLNDLIDALERENDDEEEVESEEKQNDLSEIQDFILSQRPDHNKIDDISRSPSLTTIQEEESFIDLTQASCDDASVKNHESSSPDMFDDNDDEADIFLTTEETNVSRKRKSESGGSFNKLSRLDDKDFDEFSLPTPSKGEISPEALSEVEILNPEKDEKQCDSSSSSHEFHTPKSTRFELNSESLRVSLENKSSPSTKNPMTPMLDYESMLTPALRAELKKFGLKAVPRTKACRLLKYIYEETHKEQNPPEAEECYASSSQVSSLESSFEEMAEESIHVSLDDPDGRSKSSTLELNLADKVKRFIRSNASLWRQVLEYEPIWLEDFVTSFKSSKDGVRKCKESQILDIFDNECITFRSRKSQNRRGGAKKSPKKTSMSS